MRARRRKLDSQENKEILRELKAIRIELNQLQSKVDELSKTSPQLKPRSLSGLRTLGTILYFLFLPLSWLKQSYFRLLQWVKFLKDPDTYWAGFYWLSFMRVLIRDVGWKEALISLWDPHRLAKLIRLRQS
jgi:hypothetical protein